MLDKEIVQVSVCQEGQAGDGTRNSGFKSMGFKLPLPEASWSANGFS